MKQTEDWELFWKATEDIESSYHLEVDRSKELQSNLSRAQVYFNQLKSLLHHEREAHQKARHELIELKVRLENLKRFAKLLRKESERLKTVYPIHDLWTAKQLEIDRLKKSADLLSEGHPDLKTISGLIQAHEAQRDELKWLLEDAEARFQEQSQRIDRFELEFTLDGNRIDRQGDSDGSAKNQISEF